VRISALITSGAILLLAAGLGGGVASMAASPAPPEALPELPREYVDTAVVQPTGKVLNVPAGGDLQTALQRAQPGDVITLAPGATYRGPFTAPKKAGDGWITVRTGAPDSALGPVGRRIGPAQSQQMPRLTAGSGSVLALAPGAHHYRFIGLEISPTPGTFLYNVVGPSSEARQDADQPHHIIFDRCYLHGDPAKGSRRGIALNGRHMAVIHSHLSDFKESGADTQALAGWNGSGPFKILDNFLEGAAENVMFGGGDPAISGLVPSDIEIRGNTFSKNAAWNPRGKAADAPRWTVKTLFELKNARRVLIEGNEFRDYSWGPGPAIVLTPRNQSGGAPWCTVEDVTIRHNLIHGVWYVMTVSGFDEYHQARPTARVLFEHNLAYDLSDPKAGDTNPKTIIVVLSPDHLIIRRNTLLTNPGLGSSFLIFANAQAKKGQGFVFRDNIAHVGTYGLGAENPPLGTTPATALDGHFSSWTFEGNLLIGAPPSERGRYPAGQLWEDSLDKVGFVDAGAKDFRLFPRSRYRTVGADVASISSAMDRYMTPARANGIR
jgi:hypothetical protein